MITMTTDPDLDDYEYQQNRSYYYESSLDVPFNEYLRELYADLHDYDN